MEELIRYIGIAQRLRSVAADMHETIRADFSRSFQCQVGMTVVKQVGDAQYEAEGCGRKAAYACRGQACELVGRLEDSTTARAPDSKQGELKLSLALKDGSQLLMTARSKGQDGAVEPRSSP